MEFLQSAKGLTKNPLGIIGLFISLIYGLATLVLSTSISNLPSPSERLPIIWFIIVFPFITLGCFVFLVIRHHPKLYSPSDYGSTDLFLKTFEVQKFEAVQVAAVSDNVSQNPDPNALVRKMENSNFNKGYFSEYTRDNVALANDFFHVFSQKLNQKPYRSKITEFRYGVQAPEYFTLSIAFNKSMLKDDRSERSILLIIRIVRDESNTLNIIAIGKDIIEKNSKVFANKIIQYVDSIADKSLIKDE
ncbi:hypothetical protein M0L20_28865 [Spirosoma sp. RP8]|uniref:Uncharacterized protein n=1 Tax=Spirosoma liriopis TaxID=2937440 RepID=A0ABT0HUT3_9BACT|nr:hypothetical protein [Spirosoma liriopis]MCK8495913.1 hypothetical protein [Spirosoma liriopis]